MRTKTLFAAALISVLAVTVASAQRGRGRGGFGQDPGRENREVVDVADFNPVRLMDPLEPIVDAPVIPANEVTDQVLPEELVLGVVIAGMPRADPLNMLT